MKDIIAAIERNDRFQSDSYGERLLQLTNAAKSNLNVDLNKLDDEISHQFGLHSVEVTGDGPISIFNAPLERALQTAPERLFSQLFYLRKLTWQILMCINHG
ncbi:unnamed protein product [Rotaria sp. Silwood2]|nr:unnamed protein product [Rotaria sp. Silwood2]